MPSRLRIGVNALYLIPGGVGGTEIYLRNLLGALAAIDRRNQYFIYVNRETGPELCPRAANFAPVETGVRARFRPGRLLWEQIGLPRESRRSRLDVMFSPGFTSPFFCRGRKITVIHDLQHRKQPQNFRALERWAWERSVSSSVKRSDRLITVSETSKRDIIEAYSTESDRISVIGHGVERDFFGLRDNADYPRRLISEAGLPECEYLLAVSTVHPHKNWEKLLAAFELLLKEESPLHLAVCGLPGKSWDALRRTIEEKGLAERVHLLGWQPRPVLLGLFKYAEALVFPSTFEGFGMPLLEAMATGLPVVCSDIPVLRETADGCATFFDPSSEEAIAEAIRKTRTFSATRDKQVALGLARAADCTWTRAAEKTLAVFLDVAKR